MEGLDKSIEGKSVKERLFNIGNGARSSSKKIWILISIWALAYLVLYEVSTYDYVVFHSLIELFAIAIAFAIFSIAWNARSSINGYFLILSVGFLFMGFVDLLHTLTYPGMIVFDNVNLDIPTQLWIVARALQAGTLILATLAIKRRRLNPYLVFFAYLVITSVLVWSVWARYFPTTYLAGTGLTTFKIVAEYVISAGLLLSAYLLYRNRHHLDKSVASLMTLSIGLAIASELLFTNYLSVNSFTNMMGHMLKLAEFYLIYLAVIKISINDPFRTLFKEVGDSEKRYRTIVDSANSLIIGLNHEGKVTLFNPSAEKLTKYHEEDVLGDSFIDRLVPEDDRSTAREIFFKVSKGMASDWQMPILTEDGERMIWWHNATIPGKDGDHYLIIGLDVTDRQAMTQRLEDLNQTMEMVHKIVLHDMKNELGVISISLELYKRKNDPEMLDLAAQAVARGIDLLERMREVEQLSAVGGVAKPIEVAELVERILSERKTPKVEFKQTGDNVQIVADDTFRIAIDNLVKNALTHAEPTKIEISVADCGDRCQITVKDDGKGIPDEVKNRLFEEGFKFGKTGNTGMGLYIVSKVIERHHGRIDIKDNDPKGTSFVITIPKMSEGTRSS
ncbi:MAG: MASE3 domain-containing protein [Methanomassiliicoccales archaeon]|jgi:PAS domain S-box-containing protein